MDNTTEIQTPTYDILTRSGLVFLGILIIVGLLGNTLSIIVFHRGVSCRKSRCSVYFKALAVADIYVLLFPGMELFLACLPNPILIRHVDVVLCKFATFNVYFAVEVSTWITVSVTVDRMLCVTFPLRFKNITEAKWMYVKLIAIVLIFCLINMYQVVLYSITILPDGDTFCTTNFSQVVKMLDAVSISLFICVLPLIINGVSNIIILRTMYRRADNYQNHGCTETQTATRLAQAQSVTYRVVAVCLVHFLSMVPNSALQIYIYVTMDGQLGTEIMNANLVLNLIYYTNSGINLFLYAATGNDFRHDLKNLCSQQRVRNRSISTITTYS